jgi:hypothetical protein
MIGHREIAFEEQSFAFPERFKGIEAGAGITDIRAYGEKGVMVRTRMDTYLQVFLIGTSRVRSLFHTSR